MERNYLPELKESNLDIAGYGAGHNYQTIADASHAAASLDGIAIEAKDVPGAQEAVKVLKYCKVRSDTADRNYIYRQVGVVSLCIKDSHIVVCFTISNISVLKILLTAFQILRVKIHTAVILPSAIS